MSSDPAVAAAPRRVVLVVDDDHVLRQMVVSVLSSQGYEVLSAATGDEALALAASEPWIDLLVTDLTLPGMNGRELAQRLKALRPTLAIVLMSGGADLTPARFNQDPRTSFLDKPFRLSELTALARRLVR